MMKREKKSSLVMFFLAVLLSYLTYMVVFSQVDEVYADYNGHLHIYLPLFSKGYYLEGWMTTPYFMWHGVVILLNRVCNIPLVASAAYSSCLFSLFSYFVMCWMVCRMTRAAGEEEDPGRAGLIAFGLSVVQGLYLYWVDIWGRYMGLYSPNPLHNPTQMCVRGFSLLCLCLVYDIWGRQKSADYRGVFFRVERGLKRYYIYLAVLLLLSALAKPTFAEMFIPTVGLLMLAEWLKKLIRKDKKAADYFRNCLRMLLCAAPALIYIVVEAVVFFVLGGSYEDSGQVHITAWLEVWRMFSDNVALSVALGMAFPLFVLLINPQYFLRDDLGKLALAGYVVGFLEGALLGEGGGKLLHGNFLWPMISGMTVFWTVAVLRLTVLERTQADTKGKRLLVNLAWFLFMLHVFSGFSYIREMIGSAGT